MFTTRRRRDARAQLASAATGLEPEQAARQLRAQGPNDVGRVKQQCVLRERVGRSINPLYVLLLSCAAVTVYLDDRQACRNNASVDSFCGTLGAVFARCFFPSQRHIA
ncbi:cation-transporting P-type ATPase [Caballeronia choica]|uniref:cation-transporting P-type ATPase n=1 Tax=Caballeronia choica TaxID=326476 RepID=UPI000B3E8C16